MPADGRPQGLAAEPAVERQDIAHVLVDEGPETAAPGEPAEDEREDDTPPRQHGARAGQGCAPCSARDERARGQAAQPEEPGRIGLEGKARGQRGASKGQRPERAGPIPGARDARGAGGEEEAQEEVALARLPRPARQVVEREEERRRGGARAPAERQAEREERGGGGGEPGEVEDAPGEVARSPDGEDGPVEEIDPGQIHVEDVAVGNQPLPQKPGHVVEEGRVVDQRPAQRAAAEVPREQGASGQSKLQSPARRTGSRREDLPPASRRGRGRRPSRTTPSPPSCRARRGRWSCRGPGAPAPRRAAR
jgi:hypothetical protein